MDLELVNQELNFSSLDENLVIRGGCDLFTTKPIGSDRKLFKTIERHLDQILEDNQLSRSIDKERKQSVSSILGSSSSPLNTANHQMMGFTRRGSGASSITSDIEISEPGTSFGNVVNSEQTGVSFHDESPFGSLKDISSRKVFAYLIAILNTTYPDHDFSNLQPTTENFHKLDFTEDLRHQFNNIMMSLGKKEDTLAWIWDTLNVYMEIQPNNLSTNGEYSQSRRKSSSNSISAPITEGIYDSDYYLKVYEFQPSDQSILEDLNYPYQTMWSNYWFIYNKKRKRVCFLYLTAINKLHYSEMNRSRSPFDLDSKEPLEPQRSLRSFDDDDFMGEGNGDDEVQYDDLNRDIIGGMEM